MGIGKQLLRHASLRSPQFQHHCQNPRVIAVRCDHASRCARRCAEVNGPGGKQGGVVQHITASEDKTSEVVDTDAKITNLTSFRDNLRTMLAKPSAAVKDSVEIQRQLTDISRNWTAKQPREKFSRTKPKRSPCKSLSGSNGTAMAAED
jgi:hypothetical protein